MKNFWRHFKLPLIVTPVVVAIMIIIGIATVGQLKGSRLRKRAESLGQGMAVVSLIIIAPFWFYGAAQFGKERREALKKAKSKTVKKRRNPEEMSD